MTEVFIVMQVERGIRMIFSTEAAAEMFVIEHPSEWMWVEQWGVQS